ncbi:MAG: leucine-rich repeat protein [Bacteroidales bacterium]|nr:leucine-rich repeat protein [Bacteroidales bacterium]
MKRLALFICTLLCANVLSAQTEFIVGNLKYKVSSSNPQIVSVGAADATITTANIPATVTYQGTTYNVTSIGYVAFADCSSLTSVTIPNSVTSIGNRAFSGCSGLTSVTIPNSVISIGEAAFYNCNSLTSITIPNSVTSIGSDYFHADGTFQNCSSLTSITIPNSVTSIGSKTFFGCSSLITITIPNSVTSIGPAVFYGCSSLTSVSLGTGITSLRSYNAYGKAPTYGFFHDCSSLTSVIFEDNSNLTYIGYGTFLNCSSLTSVTIPNSVTSIGGSAFEGCSSLTSMTVEMNNIPNLSDIRLNSTLQNLTIGENVTSIASGAFNNYSFLQNITCLASTPPTLEDNTVFPYPNIASLKVPCGTLETYSSATSFWNMFFAGRISENGYNVEVSVNDETFGSVTVESDCSTGTLIATANEGYRFVIWNDGNTDNPRTVALTSDTAFTAIFAAIDESSLSEDAEVAKIGVYPNPISGFVTVEFETLQEHSLLRIADLGGRVVKTFDLAAGTESVRLDIRDLPSGVYTLMIGNTTKKLIVE